MSLGYRTILTAENNSTETIQGIVSAFGAWVKEKKGFPSVPQNATVTNSKGDTLNGAVLASGSVNLHAMRWTLVEDWDYPKWAVNADNVQPTPRTGITRITLVAAEQTLWLWVDVEPPTLHWKRRDGQLVKEIQTSGRPTFVRDILDRVSMRDGLATPQSDFQIIATPKHAEELAEILEDEGRIGAVLVTAPPQGIDVGSWARTAERYVGAIQGMGIGYVLAPPAQFAFNENCASNGHGIPSGGIRTFLPGANLDDSRDAINHRLLHPSTLKESNEKRIQRILRNAQIARLNSIRIPDVLREVDYEFLRAERLQPFEALRRPEEPGRIRTLEEDAAAWRELAEQAEQTLLLTLDENHLLAERAKKAESFLDELQLENDEQYEQLSNVQNRHAELERQVQYLQRRLNALGSEGAEAAYAFIDNAPVNYPVTFKELVDRVRIGELPGVHFEGGFERTLELDEHTLLGEAIVMKTWDTLLSFDTYVRARKENDYGQSLRHFCMHGAKDGYLVRVPRIVWSEGETVRNNTGLRAQRTFPVARTVDPSGALVMWPHVRLSNLTGVAPRLYFEDTFQKAGFVSIGFIGSHPDNTNTN